MPKPRSAAQTPESLSGRPENTRITRSKAASDTTTPPTQEPESSQEHTVMETPDNNAQQSQPNASGAKQTGPIHALFKVARRLEIIISKHSPSSQLKLALMEVVNEARKAGDEELGKGEHITPNAVETLHKHIRADLLHPYNGLNSRIVEVQNRQKQILNSAEIINKATVNLQSTTKELEDKVGKVNNTTDKIANTTMSYKEALLSNPSNMNKAGVDLKVLNDLDRKARQILISYSSTEDNATLNTSLLDLKDKANQVIDNLEDPTRPTLAKVEGVTRTRDGLLLLIFNLKEAADWIREPDVEYKFTDKFAIRASFKDRKYNMLIRWVPTTFDLANRTHHWEIEEANGLPKDIIHKARWIKLINRRKSGQSKVHAVLTFSSAESANLVIRDGVDICRVRVRAEKLK